MVTEAAEAVVPIPGFVRVTPHANKGKADICLVHESEAQGERIILGGIPRGQAPVSVRCAENRRLEKIRFDKQEGFCLKIVMDRHGWFGFYDLCIFFLICWFAIVKL